MEYRPSASVHQCKFRNCWLSGWSVNYRPEGYYGPTGLQIAHIASGQGRALRVDDRRAVVLLAPIPHSVHVSNSDRLPYMTINGVRYKTIDERHTLWLKRELDPEYFDLSYLSTVWIGKVPEPERPPQEWCDEFTRRTGIAR